MSTENQTDIQERASNDVAQVAQVAFEAAFSGVPEKAAPAELVQREEVKAEAPEVEVVPEPVKEAAPQPTPKADDQELRRLHGRIGQLNDDLQQLKKARDAEGKPVDGKPAAPLTKFSLEKIKSEYPELGALLEDDLSQALSGMRSTPDAEQLQALVAPLLAKQLGQEIAKFREESVNDRHENWKTDLWMGEPGRSERSADYEAWRKTIPEADANALENSDSPSFVNRKLDQFYDWKTQASKTKTAKQDRLKAAITPQGTARQGPASMSEEEAAQKAFDDAFN